MVILWQHNRRRDIVLFVFFLFWLTFLKQTHLSKEIQNQNLKIWCNLQSNLDNLQSILVNPTITLGPFKDKLLRLTYNSNIYLLSSAFYRQYFCVMAVFRDQNEFLLLIKFSLKFIKIWCAHTFSFTMNLVTAENCVLWGQNRI